MIVIRSVATISQFEVLNIKFKKIKGFHGNRSSFRLCEEIHSFVFSGKAFGSH